MILIKIYVKPNQSPDPNAVGAGCHRATVSAVAVHVARPARLNFGRHSHRL